MEMHTFSRDLKKISRALIKMASVHFHLLIENFQKFSIKAFIKMPLVVEKVEGCCQLHLMIEN